MRYHRQQPHDWERRSGALAPAPKPRQRTPVAASASGGAALAAPGRGGATAFVICVVWRSGGRRSRGFPTHSLCLGSGRRVGVTKSFDG
jgi:hypothetical protein